MSYAFISYSREDKEEVEAVIDRIREYGFDVWIDTAEIYPGDSWWRQIEQGIRGCGVFIVFMSSNSYKSDVVHDEIQTALHYEKFIIPVKIDLVFRELQKTQYATWDIQREVAQLIKVLEDELPQKRQRGRDVTPARRKKRWPLFLGLFFLLLLLLGGGILAFLLNPPDEPDADTTLTAPATVTRTATAIPTLTDVPPPSGSTQDDDIDAQSDDPIRCYASYAAVPSPRIRADGVRYYSLPTSNSAWRGTMDPGEYARLIAVDRNTGWYLMLNRNNAQAWISNTAGTVQGDTASLPRIARTNNTDWLTLGEATPAPNRVMVRRSGTDEIRIYCQQTTASLHSGWILSGVEAQVLGLNRASGWYLVELLEPETRVTRIGWVNASEVDVVQGNINAVPVINDTRWIGSGNP